MDNEMSIGVAVEGGITYITFSFGVGEEDVTIGFTIPQAISVLKTLSDAIQQAVSSQKAVAN